MKQPVSIPALPLMTLPLAVVLLQFHAVAYWSWAITGGPIGWSWAMLLEPWNGWGWSVLLELGNLWAWPRARRFWWGLLAVVTTLLLVAGPLYRVSDPLVRELFAPPPVAAETPRITAQRREIAGLEQTLAAYRADWRLRPRIPEAQAELARRHARLDSLLADQAAAAERARLDWRRTLVIAGQLAAIALAQILAVLSVVALFGTRKAAPEQRSEHSPNTAPDRSPEPAPNSPNTSGTPNPEPGGAPGAPQGHGLNPSREREAIRAYARRHGLTSQGAVADAIGEPRSTLSEWANGKLPPESHARIARKLLG